MVSITFITPPPPLATTNLHIGVYPNVTSAQRSVIGLDETFAFHVTSKTDKVSLVVFSHFPSPPEFQTDQTPCWKSFASSSPFNGVNYVVELTFERLKSMRRPRRVP